MGPEPLQHAGDFSDSALFIPATAPAIGRFAGDGDYDVFDVFEGGMAEVYLCAPRVGPRIAYAFKSLKSERLLEPALQRAFRRECSIAVRFAGIMGILPVYGVVEHRGRPFLKMQGVLPDEHNVVSLRDVIERGPVPPLTVGYYLDTLTWAMSMAADRSPGLVHSDIKPENILMLLGVPNIADFGLATMHRMVSNEVLVADEEYMCPEALAGATPTASWDVYSFGVLLTEMLTGQRSGQTAVANGLDDPVATKLLAISDLCRKADPSARPDMLQFRRYILAAAPGDGWPVPESATKAYELRSVMALNAIISEGSYVLSSLLRNQDYDGVLYEVDRMRTEDRTWRDFLHRGTALSMLGRDEEALASYDEAEQALHSADPGQLDLIFLERAASLKRLGRYEAASPILERLMLHASDEKTRARARVNLGALLVESGQHERARRLLREALANVTGPDASESLRVAYINLGVLERDSGNHEAAVAALRQAIAAKPFENQARILLADILLFLLDRAEEAAAILDGAIGVGSIEEDVLRKRLMCAELMLDAEATVRILALFREQDPQDDLNGRWIDARMDAAIHLRRFGKPDLELEQSLPEDIRDTIPAWADSWPDEPPSDTDSAPTTVGNDDDDDIRKGDAGDPGTDWDPDLAPHIRPDHAMGFDYYISFDREDVVARIVDAYRMVESVISHHAGTYMTGSPVLLVTCPACGAQIATTRPEGDPLDCRCGAANLVTPSTDSHIAALRTRLVRVLYPDGEKSLNDWAVILLMQLPGLLSLPAARWFDGAIERHGLERLDDNHSGRAYVIAWASQNDGMLRGLSLVALRWYYPPEARGSSHVMPEPMQAFLTEVRTAFNARLNSVSFAYDTKAEDFESLVMDGQLDKAEALLVNTPTKREHVDAWNFLAALASARRDLDAATRYTRAAVTTDPENAEAWYAYAALLLRNDQTADALDAAEHACELEPANGTIWSLLAQCRHSAGDKEGAAEAVRRAMSLGSNPDEFPAIFADEDIDYGLLAQVLEAAIIGDSESQRHAERLIAITENWDEDGPSIASALRRLLAGEPEDTVLDGLAGPAEVFVTLVLTEIRARRSRSAGGNVNLTEGADSLENFGLLRARQGQLEEARDLLQRTLRLRESIGDAHRRALTANNLATVLLKLHQFDDAEDLLQQCLAYQRNASDRQREANCITNLGDVYREKGLPREAVQFHGSALEIYRELDEQAHAANALISLGVDRRLLEDYAGARDAYREALEIYTRNEVRDGRGRALFNLCLLDARLNAWQDAAEESAQAAAIFRELEDLKMEASALKVALQANVMLESWVPAEEAYHRLTELGVLDADS